MFQEYQYYIIFASTTAWLLPPFRQFGGKYFYYFLILAFTDVVIVGLYFGINIITPSALFYSLSSLLLYILLFNKEEIFKKKYFLSGLVILILWGLTLASNKHKYTALCIIHTFIMYEFLKRLAIDYSLKEVVNIFLLLLFTYETTIVIKFVVSALDLRWGVLYFDLMSILEVLLALTFAIFKEQQLTINVSHKQNATL